MSSTLLLPLTLLVPPRKTTALGLTSSISPLRSHATASARVHRAGDRHGAR